MADEPLLPIGQIQGDGPSSPYVGQWVTTTEAVVTAVGDGVFFVQSPDGRGDDDPATSDGLAVLAWAAVAVGDVVDVRGRVQEYYDLTRLVGATATVSASGQPLPAPLAFDAATPSPQPAGPGLERFEGMRVAVTAGTVTGPTNQYGDAVAVATAARPFREPGVEYPGLPDLPVWDGNPERFDLAPYALGGPHRALAAGSRFTAVGVLSHAYGDFQLWPTELTILAEPTLPRPVRPALPDELRVASQNLERLGPGAADAGRRAKLSLHLREVMGAPEVVAVQEAIGLAALAALAERIAADDPAVVYTPLVLDSQSYGDIQVGFLVKGSVAVRSLTQIGAEAQISTGGRLFDRPPLVLELTAAGRDLTVIAVHLRSLIDIDDPSQGSFVRRKRHEGAVWLSRWLDDRLTADQDEALVVIGDFNAFPFSDGYVDVLGQITGAPDPAGALLPATDELDPDLANAQTLLPPGERYSYVFDGNAQALDHVLVSRAAAAALRAVAYTRGNADAPAALADDVGTAAVCSDHDGVVAYFGGPRQRPGGRRQP